MLTRKLSLVSGFALFAACLLILVVDGQSSRFSAKADQPADAKAESPKKAEVAGKPSGPRANQARRLGGRITKTTLRRALGLTHARAPKSYTRAGKGRSRLHNYRGDAAMRKVHAIGGAAVRPGTHSAHRQELEISTPQSTNALRFRASRPVRKGTAAQKAEAAALNTGGNAARTASSGRQSPTMAGHGSAGSPGTEGMPPATGSGLSATAQAGLPAGAARTADNALTAGRPMGAAESGGGNPAAARRTRDASNGSITAGSSHDRAALAHETLKPAPPLDDWEKHVVQISQRYEFTEAQDARARSILDDLKSRAVQYQLTRSNDFSQANRIEDKAEREARLTELAKPIDKLFNELNLRLENLPTIAQLRNAQPRRPASAQSK